MPTLEDQDNQQDQRSVYDDAGSWDTKVGGFDWRAAEKDATSKGNESGYDENNPSSKANNPLDGDGLKSAEKADSTKAPGTSGAALPGEKSSLEKASFESGKALGEAQKNGPMSRFGQMAVVMKSRRGKTVGISGAIITLILAGFGFFAATNEMIHIKENYIGKGNIAQNFSMKNRRARSAFTALRRIANIQSTAGTLAEANKFNTKAVKSSLNKAGFEVVETTDGKIASISKEVLDGDELTKHTLDFASDNIDNEISKFMDNIGSEGIQQLDKASRAATGMWKGPFARGFYSSRLASSLKNWLKGRQSDPTKTPEENAKATIVDAEKPEVDIPEDRGAARASEEFTEVDENGNVKQTGADPTELVDDLGDSIDNDIGELAGSLGGTADNVSAEVISEQLQAAALKVGRTGITAGLLSGLDATQWAQLSCKALATLQWVATASNIFLTIELARFALRYLNAADSQKAGVLTSGAIALYLTYYRMGRSTGSYSSSPGLNYALGDHTKQVSSGSRGLYSTGRSNGGALKYIYNFIYSIPGVRSEGFRNSCKLLNNGWFQAGSIVVGVVAAVFTLGGSYEASFGAQAFLIAGLQAAITLTLEIGGPLLARTGQHVVVAEIKDTLGKGDALGSGLGALSAMTSSANSMLITTSAKSAALRVAALAEEKEIQKKQSVFDRYLSMKNGTSLLSRLAFSAPRSIPDASQKATTTIASSLNPLSAIGRISGSTYAQTPSSCLDEQLTNYATDPFCNPEVSTAPDLDLQQTYQLLLNNGQIDAEGKPIGTEFKNFIKRCASGQPTLVYNTEVDKNVPQEDKIDDCTSDAVALNGETTSSSKAYAYIYKAQPKPSFFAQLFGQRAYAQTDGNKLVSMRERFAAWQGFIVDTSAIVEDMNGVFSGEQVNPFSDIYTTARGGGPSEVIVPNSTGYTIPCTGLPSTPKLNGERIDAINWNAIPESGTLGVASDGAPIKVYIREPCVKTDVKTVTIASSIHGTENEGQDISFQLLFKKSLPANMRVIAIPEINHAGINNDPGRINANGVNLNRNFDYGWTAIPRSADNNYSGPSANSEPETKALKDFLLSLKENNLLIAYHDNIHYVVASSALGQPASKSYFNYIVGQGVTGFTNTGGKQNTAIVQQPGSLDAWYAHNTNTPTLLVELKSLTSDVETGVHADAIINLVKTGVLK